MKHNLTESVVHLADMCGFLLKDGAEKKLRADLNVEAILGKTDTIEKIVRKATKYLDKTGDVAAINRIKYDRMVDLATRAIEHSATVEGMYLSKRFMLRGSRARIAELENENMRQRDQEHAAILSEECAKTIAETMLKSWVCEFPKDPLWLAIGANWELQVYSDNPLHSDNPQELEAILYRVNKVGPDNLTDYSSGQIIK